jgi:hypothetical protein
MSPGERRDREGGHREFDKDDAAAASGAVKQCSPPAANDNTIAWPLIPFPDGWHAS